MDSVLGIVMKMGNSLLHFAVQGGSLEMVQYLVEKCKYGSNVGQIIRWKHPTIWHIIIRRNVQRLKHILQSGAVLRMKNVTEIQWEEECMQIQVLSVWETIIIW